MTKILTCIVCPAGCEIGVSDRDGALTVTGEGCSRGKAYALSEMTDPRRTFATSVRVLGGEEPLCSVRLTRPIPRADVMEAAKLIHALRLTAPVEAGTVLIHHILGTDSDVIATRDVAAAAPGSR